MRLLAAIAFLASIMSSRASAQLGQGDSLAVATVINRYHAALVQGDRTELRRVLAPGALVFERGTVRRLEGETLNGEIRVGQAMTRNAEGIAYRGLGLGVAMAYSIAEIAARANPALFHGQEVESVVLSRQGRTWFIESISRSTRESPP